MTDSWDTSNLERAKALKALEDIASDGNLESLLGRLTVDPEVKRAVAGLRQEDEFALLCRLMGTVTHCTHLEQRPLIRNDSLAPDFLARFLPGYSVLEDPPKSTKVFPCFVEVKSTTKDRLKIGGSLLARRRRFAASFGLPLILSVRFLRFGQNALWVMVPDEPSETAVHVTYASLETGWRSILWDDYFLMPHPGMRLSATFDKALTGMGVMNEAFGSLRSIEFEGSGPPMVMEGPSANLTLLLMESFDLVEDSVRTEGSRTQVRYRTTTPSCSIVDIVYRANLLVTDDTGRPAFDASRVLARSDQPDEVLLDRFMVEKIAEPLCAVRLLLRIGLGEPDAVRQKLSAATATV